MDTMMVLVILLLVALLAFTLNRGSKCGPAGSNLPLIVLVVAVGAAIVVFLMQGKTQSSGAYIKGEKYVDYPWGSSKVQAIAPTNITLGEKGDPIIRSIDGNVNNDNFRQAVQQGNNKQVRVDVVARPATSPQRDEDEYNVETPVVADVPAQPMKVAGNFLDVTTKDVNCHSHIIANSSLLPIMEQYLNIHENDPTRKMIVQSYNGVPIYDTREPLHVPVGQGPMTISGRLPINT